MNYLVVISIYLSTKVFEQLLKKAGHDTELSAQKLAAQLIKKQLDLEEDP